MGRFVISRGYTVVVLYVVAVLLAGGEVAWEILMQLVKSLLGRTSRTRRVS